MKSFWSLAAKLLFVIVLIQVWFLYDMHRENAALLSVNDEYSKYMEDSEAKIAELQEKLADTEKRTVEGILKETNKAVVQGWESLLNKVEEELEKAKDAVPELLELEPTDTLPAKPDAEQVSPEVNESTAPNDSNSSEPANESGTSPSEPESQTVPPVLIPGDVT